MLGFFPSCIMGLLSALRLVNMQCSNYQWEDIARLCECRWTAEVKQRAIWEGAGARLLDVVLRELHACAAGASCAGT